MKARILFIECLTNMHVGSGDVNYNIIDNEVERDPITNYPTINASGVKGALRELLTQECENSEKCLSKEEINSIFGSEENKTQGIIKFLNADLIALPQRVTKGKRAYELCTSDTIINNIKSKITSIFSKKIEVTFENIERDSNENSAQNIQIEGYKPEAIKNLKFSKLDFKIENLMQFDDETFRKFELPVIARNKLENGVSKNLWYEEVVPYKSIFMIPLIIVNKNDEPQLNGLVEILKNKTLQFGGNASIGYGLCSVIGVLGGDYE